MGDLTIISTTLLAATDLTLVSLEDVKEELQITDSSSDAWLTKVISRASTAVRNYCNRVLQVQTYQDLVWPFRDAYPWQVPGRIMPLQLSAWPIACDPSPSQTAPPTQPSITAIAGGSLSAASYYVKASYVTPFGETAASVEAALPVAASKLLQVSSPGPDPSAIATGWNVYVGTQSGMETRQNAAPINVGSSWTLPTSGLVSGAPLPSYILVVENSQLMPAPLCEGRDFIVDAQHGQLTRLFPVDQYARSWDVVPVLAQYPAGYAPMPDDILDATLRLVKARWFARLRDPLLRSETAVGIWSSQYFFGSGPGSANAFPPEVTAMLDQYRVPVVT